MFNNVQITFRYNIFYHPTFILSYNLYFDDELSNIYKEKIQK